MSIAGNPGESDEEFARRLQAQEMGLTIQLSSRNRNNAEADAPLIDESDGSVVQRGRRQNPTVINARINDIATARITVMSIIFVNVPQGIIYDANLQIIII